MLVNSSGRHVHVLCDTKPVNCTYVYVLKLFVYSYIRMYAVNMYTQKSCIDKYIGACPYHV